MPKGCLQGHQGEELRDDWFWPLSLFVKREWTSFCRRRLWGLLDFSRPPRYLWGNLEAGMPGHFALYDYGGVKVWYPNDIPPDGCWYVSWPFYIAWTQRTRDSKRLWRFGFRYTKTTTGAGAPAWEPAPQHNYYNFPAGPALRELSPDLAHALSRQQLRNHLLHAAVAVPVCLFLGHFGTHPWLSALLAVVAVAGAKEWFEVMRRLRLGLVVHWWDGVFDFAGWILFWGVSWLSYSLFVR